MGGVRDASGQNSLMMRAAQRSNAQPAWMLLWPAKGFASSQRTQSGKEMLIRIVAMLTKLVARFDPYQYRVRENSPSVAGPFEHEDDDEHEDD
jgi:hypothetical protein